MVAAERLQRRRTSCACSSGRPGARGCSQMLSDTRPRACESTIRVRGRTCLCWSAEHSSGRGSGAREGSTLGSPEFSGFPGRKWSIALLFWGSLKLPRFLFFCVFPSCHVATLHSCYILLPPRPPHSHAFFPVWFWYKERQK